MGNTRNLGDIGRIPDNDLGGLVFLRKEVVSSSVSAVDLDLPAGYTRYRLVLEKFEVDSYLPTAQLSYDGGSTFANTTYAYKILYVDFNGSTISSAGSTTDSAFMLATSFSGGATTYEINNTINIANSADVFSYDGAGNVRSNTGQLAKFTATWRRAQTAKADTLRLNLIFSGSAISAGTISLYGSKETL